VHPEQRATERLNEIILEVTGRPGLSHSQRINTTPALADALHGLDMVLETRDIAHWTDLNTARQEIARLERRVNSNTWTIPDHQMPEIVRRFTAVAIEVFGGLDTESRATAYFTVDIAHFRP
ncbi:MAG: hypothetical protein ABIP13_02100, partial [Tepidiformaceae bacterium]